MRRFFAPKVSTLSGVSRFAAPALVSSARFNSFKVKGRVGSSNDSDPDSNPWMQTGALKQQHLVVMCGLCVLAGYVAGQMTEVDEDELHQVKFNKDEILKRFQETFEFRPDLAPTILRLAFTLAARRAGVASDAVEESCSVYRGFEDIAGTMSFNQMMGEVSMEDTVALGAIAAIKFMRGPADDITFRWNRVDSDVPKPRIEGKKGGDGHFSIPLMLRAVGGLEIPEMVAVMSSHAVGKFHEDVSGVDGKGRLPRHYTLGTRYYKVILEHQKEFKRMEVYRTEDNAIVDPLPTDFVHTNVIDKRLKKTKDCIFSGREVAQLLKDPQWFEWVKTFAKDKSQWEKHYASGMQKILDSNHRVTLRDYKLPQAVAPPATDGSETQSEAAPAAATEAAK